MLLAIGGEMAFVIATSNLDATPPKPSGIYKEVSSEIERIAHHVCGQFICRSREAVAACGILGIGVGGQRYVCRLGAVGFSGIESRIPCLPTSAKPLSGCPDTVSRFVAKGDSRNKPFFPANDLH